MNAGANIIAMDMRPDEVVAQLLEAFPGASVTANCMCNKHHFERDRELKVICFAKVSYNGRGSIEVMHPTLRECVETLLRMPKPKELVT